MVTNGQPMRARIEQWDKVIDRRMDDELNKFKRAIFAKHLRPAFLPYQSPVPWQEFQRLVSLMVANAAEVQVIVNSTDPALIKLGQQLEKSLEAALEKLFTIEVQRRECWFMRSGWVMVALEPRPGAGVELAKLADRQALQKYAEGDEEPEDDDDAPQARYRRAYKATKKRKLGYEDEAAYPDKPDYFEQSHDEAYTAVSDDAKLRDGFGWRVRIIDPLTANYFDGDEPDMVAIGMEHGKKPLNPILTALGGWGLKKGADGRLSIEKTDDEKKDPADSASYAAVGSGVVPMDTTVTGGLTGDMVEFTQIRTCEATFILVEHPESAGVTDKAGDPGACIELPNMFGGASTGYYILSGDDSVRGAAEDRHVPPILALIVEAMYLNIITTGQLAMAIEEVGRDPYTLDENQSSEAVEPYEPTSETKAVVVKESNKPLIASGEVKRIETTGVKLAEIRAVVEAALQRAESRDMLAGTGSSSETGIHLARLQTALLTLLVPHQVKRAALRKRVLEDLLRYVAATGETITLPYLPESAVEKGERKPELRQITPKMAKLPLDIRVTVGAETPESKAAKEAMSEHRTQFGASSMTDHMDVIGVKDPAAMMQRIARDSIVRRWIGTVEQPGTIAAVADAAIAAYLKAGIEQRLGPAPPAPVILGPDGLPLPPSQDMIPPAGGPLPLQRQPQIQGQFIAPGGMEIPA